MPPSFEERRLAQEMAYDEAVLTLVKPHAAGEYGGVRGDQRAEPLVRLMGGRRVAWRNAIRESAS